MDASPPASADDSVGGAVVAFAKCPIAGASKTRLAPLLGADGAAALARAMLSDPDPEVCELAQAELEQKESQRAELEGQIRGLLIPKDPNDEKNVIIENRAGTGGRRIVRCSPCEYASRGWHVPKSPGKSDRKC